MDPRSMLAMLQGGASGAPAPMQQTGGQNPLLEAIKGMAGGMSGAPDPRAAMDMPPMRPRGMQSAIDPKMMMGGGENRDFPTQADKSSLPPQLGGSGMPPSKEGSDEDMLNQVQQSMGKTTSDNVEWQGGDKPTKEDLQTVEENSDDPKIVQAFVKQFGPDALPDDVKVEMEGQDAEQSDDKSA